MLYALLEPSRKEMRSKRSKPCCVDDFLSQSNLIYLLIFLLVRPKRRGRRQRKKNCKSSLLQEPRSLIPR